MNLTNYIVYDEATGEIRRTGTCPESLLEDQCRPGEAVMKGEARDTLHRVATAKGKASLVTLSASEQQARKPAARPAPVSEFQQVYKILERLEQRGYDLGPDWEAMKNKRT